MNKEATLLRVHDLTVHYKSDDGTEISAVDGVSLRIAPGEGVGLLGESGCGKTTLGLSLLRLLPSNAQILGGSVLFRSRDLLGLNEDQLREVRGAEISMVSQEPGISLNPVVRAGEQVAEVIRAHRPWSRRRCRDEARAVLEQVHLPEVARAYAAYPHQLSGGQRQRVVIAQAIACRPGLVIADEPTTSLDAILQAEILDLLGELKERFQIALLFITHDPAILAKLADRILVMYAGRIVEEGPTSQVLRYPLHPYTRGLLRCLPERPEPDRAPTRKPLPCIVGSPPDPTHIARGCRFEPRCPDRIEICSLREPAEVQPEAERRVRCFIYGG